MRAVHLNNLLPEGVALKLLRKQHGIR
jgi:hypothetical protein